MHDSSILSAPCNGKILHFFDRQSDVSPFCEDHMNRRCDFSSIQEIFQRWIWKVSIRWSNNPLRFIHSLLITGIFLSFSAIDEIILLRNTLLRIFHDSCAKGTWERLTRKLPLAKYISSVVQFKSISILWERRFRLPCKKGQRGRERIWVNRLFRLWYRCIMAQTIWPAR